MAGFNGSGLFVRVYNWVTDRDNSVKIRADRMDTEMDGFATGLSACITKDGQTTVTANIPMNSKKFTGLGDGTATGQSVHWGQVRDRLTASRNYYVRSDGSNSNTGLANTAGGAWLTLQYAQDWCFNNLDLAGNYLNINVADGTYAGFTAVGLFVGQYDHNRPAFIGNTTTPANCIISSAGICVTASEHAAFLLTGFKITSSGNYGISVTRSAFVGGLLLNFGTCSLGHIFVAKKGEYFQSADYTISGNAPVHGIASDFGLLILSTVTCTLTGTPAFSTSFVQGTYGGIVTSHDVIFSGACTGLRFAATFNSIVGGGASVTGGDLTYYPGNTAGTTDDTSLYNGVIIGTAWTDYNPTVASSGGSITTYSVTSAAYKLDGKACHFRARIAVSNIGTATGFIKIDLPFAILAAASCPILGFNTTTNKPAPGLANYHSTATASFIYADGTTFPVANGESIFVGGTYEIA